MQNLLPVLLLCMAPADAFAYIDPGTGSLLLQGLIASIVGGIFVLRGQWSRLRNFLLRRTKGSDSSPNSRDER